MSVERLVFRILQVACVVVPVADKGLNETM
jgi:hypothetical protein